MQTVLRSKKAHIVALMLCTQATSSLGAIPVPATRPIDLPISIHYMPGFQYSCTSKNTNSQSKDEHTQQVSGAVYLRDGMPKVSGTVEYEGKELGTVIFAVDNSLSALLSDAPEFSGPFAAQVEKLNGKQRQAFDQLLSSLQQKFNAAVPFMGKPVKQGNEFELPSLCSLTSGWTNVSTTGGAKVLGVSKLEDRDSLIVQRKYTSRCSLKDSLAEISVEGWSAFDVQSGLLKASSLSTLMTNKNFKTQSTETMECTLHRLDGTPLPAYDLEKNAVQVHSQEN